MEAVSKVTRTCQTAVYTAASKIKECVNKVLDFVLPRNPVTKEREFRFVPLFVENFLGESLFNSECPIRKTCTDKALTDNVKEVFKKVVAQCDRKDLKYEIRVLEDNKTVNAFCAPGGKVIITTAMLNALKKPLDVEPELQNVTFDDKLAAVLGHEITHAAAGHGARRLQVGLLIYMATKIGSFVLPRILVERRKEDKPGSYEIKVGALEVLFDFTGRIGSFFFMQHRSRCHEFEADKFGIKYAVKAGYKGEGALYIQRLLKKVSGEKKEDPGFLEFLKTHPTSDQRYEANKKTVDKIKRLGVDKTFP